MTSVLIHHKVTHFNTWKEAFDSTFMFRKDSGETSVHLYQAIHDANDVTLWFEWESAESAEKFVNSPEFARQMKLAGVEGRPDISVLHEVLAVRRTAAD